jgi:hypothetical protein
VRSSRVSLHPSIPPHLCFAKYEYADPNDRLRHLLPANKRAGPGRRRIADYTCAFAFGESYFGTSILRLALITFVAQSLVRLFQEVERHCPPATLTAGLYSALHFRRATYLARMTNPSIGISLEVRRHLLRKYRTKTRGFRSGLRSRPSAVPFGHGLCSSELNDSRACSGSFARLPS